MDTQSYSSLVFHPSPATISSASDSGYRRLMLAPNMSWQGQPQVDHLTSSSDHGESSHVYPTGGLSAGDTQHYSQTNFPLRPATNTFVSDSEYSSGSSTETPTQINFESPHQMDNSAPESARRAARRDTEASDIVQWHNYNDVSIIQHRFYFSVIYVHLATSKPFLAYSTGTGRNRRKSPCAYAYA